jgi:hypothetical protein
MTLDQPLGYRRPGAVVALQQRWQEANFQLGVLTSA